MIKIVVMPDKFKGTLRSDEAAEAICRGIERACDAVGRGGVEVVSRPMADGGDGTLRILAREDEIVRVSGYDALMRPVETEFGIKTDSTVRHGIIESATSIGLSRLRRTERNPELTSSYGLGFQIVQALEAGCRKLTIGVGGTATNDCGVGMLSALGVRFYDAYGRHIEYPCGRDLARITTVELGTVPERLDAVEIRIMCDVDNPLLGVEGATRIFGRQKGASPEMVERLETGADRFAALLTDTIGRDLRDEHGSGAAGGIGWALRMVSGAHYAKGAATVAEVTAAATAATDASLLVTGEGRCDTSSLHSKVVGYVAELGRQLNIPVLVLCGMREREMSAESLRTAGITGIYALTDYMSAHQAMTNPCDNLMQLTEAVFKQIL